MMGDLPLRRRVGLFVVHVLLGGGVADAGVMSAYRRKLEATVEMPLDADVFRVPPGYDAPQQVHITLGDQDGTTMIMSLTVRFGEHPDPEKMERRAEGTHTRYEYFNYTSGRGRRHRRRRVE